MRAPSELLAVLLPSEPHRRLVLKTDVVQAWLDVLTSSNSSNARGAALLGLQVCYRAA